MASEDRTGSNVSDWVELDQLRVSGEVPDHKQTRFRSKRVD